MALVTISIQVISTEAVGTFVLVCAMVAWRFAFKALLGDRFLVIKLWTVVKGIKGEEAHTIQMYFVIQLCIVRSKSVFCFIYLNVPIFEVLVTHLTEL